MKLELVVKNDKVLTSSRTIAKAFGKEIGSVHRDIRDRFGDDGKNHHEQLQEVKDYRGYVTEYLLDEYQAVELIMGFTGKKAREIKRKLISVYLDVRPAGADPLGFHNNTNKEGK